MIGYKVSQTSAQLPNIEKNFVQNMHFILQQKEQQLEYIAQKLAMNDPEKKHKKRLGTSFCSKERLLN